MEAGRPPLFESGTILLHLAERHGRFLPPSGDPAPAESMAWLMVALTSLGTMTGQAHHWTELAAEKSPAARTHTVAQVQRAYGLLEGSLGTVPHLAGWDHSVADIAAYPWIGPPWLGGAADGGLSRAGAVVRPNRRTRCSLARHAGSSRSDARMNRIGRLGRVARSLGTLALAVAMGTVGASAQQVAGTRVLRVVPNADLQTLDPRFCCGLAAPH